MFCPVTVLLRCTPSCVYVRTWKAEAMNSWGGACTHRGGVRLRRLGGERLRLRLRVRRSLLDTQKQRATDLALGGRFCGRLGRPGEPRLEQTTKSKSVAGAEMRKLSLRLETKESDNGGTYVEWPGG